MQEGALPEARAALNESVSFSDQNPTRHDPAPFVGSASCAECHREKFQERRGSRHARTFHRAADLGDLTLPPRSLPDPGRVTVAHTLRKAGDRLEQVTQTPEKVFQAVADYAFGSGDRGLTLVGHEASGQKLELRSSIYGDGKQSIWDVTSGHPQHPTNARDFLGMPLNEDTVGRCLLCHVTNPRAVLENSGPEAADHAIGCEKCHGPGGNHLLAVAGEFPDLAIARPSLTSGSQRGSDLRTVPQPSWRVRFSRRIRRRFDFKAPP